MKKILAEILTIGDEILYGQITDTNSQWIGEQLNNIGIKVIRRTSVGDEAEDISTALKEASERASIVITTGGLGPTKDDITKKTFAEYFGVGMKFEQAVLENIKALFKQKGRELTRLNEVQAEIPANAEVIMNTIGTAPGMWFEEEGKVYISMPGVPYEMKKMMLEQVFKRLQVYFDTDLIYHKMFRTIGVPESILAQQIGQWEDALPEHIKLAYLPRLGQVRLRLTAVGDKGTDLAAEVENQAVKLRELIGRKIYGEDQEEIESAIGKLLVARNETLAVAESCTGGLVSNSITNLAGCSAYFKGGIVSYSNEVKVSQLGVRTATLEQYGAVSRETAIEMAEQVRDRYGANYGISTTGIAGPNGGTPNKPVGTIWIGYADHAKSEAKLLTLTKDRQLNINYTHTALMYLLWKRIIEKQEKALAAEADQS